MFVIVAINNSSLIMAGRKKRSMSGDVTATTTSQLTAPLPALSVASDSDGTKLASSKSSTNGDSTSKKAKCGEMSCDRASTLDAGSSSVSEETTSETVAGTVAKVAERRKSELTLTIKCSQAKNSAADESSDEDDDDDDDDDDDADGDSDSSSSSSSNSEDKLQFTTKRPFSSSVDHEPRTKFPTRAKTTNKKQQAAGSDSSQGSSDREARRNVPPSSSAASAAGAGSSRTTSKVTKRKSSVNSESPSRKRRRSSTNSQVGCESELLLLLKQTFFIILHTHSRYIGLYAYIHSYRNL